MMSSTVAGIDPHQDTFTVAVIDPNGVETVHDTFDNSSCGYVAAIELLNTQGVARVGVEGSASWGSHVAVALAAAGVDAREVPRNAQRSSVERPASSAPNCSSRDPRRSGPSCRSTTTPTAPPPPSTPGGA
jgi:hypothetical protein